MDAEPTAIGHRERKKLATRHALAVAALHLALERGLENVRIEDVASRAGVAPRTFNNYFASKEDAIVSLDVDRAQRVSGELLARPEDEQLGHALAELFVAQYAPDAEPDSSWVQRARLIASSPALQGASVRGLLSIEEALSNAISQRMHASPADLEPRVLAASVSGAVRVAVLHWLDLEGRSPLPAVLRAAIGVVVNDDPERPPRPS